MVYLGKFRLTRRFQTSTITHIYAKEVVVVPILVVDPI